MITENVMIYDDKKLGEGSYGSVYLCVDDEGNKIVQVKTRDLRIPELGDKYANPHGQKGVIGALIEENENNKNFVILVLPL